jgi:nucleoid-associated protein YgaU
VRSLHVGLLCICAAASLLLLACGGTAAAPTATPASAPANSPVPSPSRPPLASPAASPSAVPAVFGSPSVAASPGVGGDSYEIQSGDTLATIAQQFYGDASQWRRIYDANKDTIGDDPDKLKLGTKLTIPPRQS